MEARCLPSAETARHTIGEPWGSLCWLASSARTGSALTVGRVVIRRGCENPAHFHDTCEEVLFLIAGELQHRIGDRVEPMRPGDTLIVPAGVLHHARSVGAEDAVMLVAYSSGTRDFRKA